MGFQSEALKPSLGGTNGKAHPAVGRRPTLLREFEPVEARPAVHLADHQVVVMAGGLGLRLRPLTARCPKPLVRVGEQPLLEIMLRRLIDQGFRRFTLCLHYRPEMFRRHFGDGARLGVEIEYVEEERRLGTAGSLARLPTRPDKAFLVINGDLLTDLDFADLFHFHQERAVEATLCVRRAEIELPFGVVELDGDALLGIEERPVQRPLINAGIYLLEPKVRDLVPSDRPFDMPELFQRLLDRRAPAAAYMLQDYWIDVGSKADLDRAKADMAQLLSP